MVQKKAGKKPILLLMLAVMLCMAFLTVTGAFAYASESASPFSIETVRDECERMTQSDVAEDAGLMPDGSKVTVDGYIKNVKANNYGYVYEYQILHSKHLYSLIPKELFCHEGDWFFKGYDYSFFVL